MDEVDKKVGLGVERPVAPVAEKAPGEIQAAPETSQLVPPLEGGEIAVERERAPEMETVQEEPSAAIAEAERVAKSAAPVAVAPVVVPKPRLLVDIESALEEDLDELYKQMPPEKRAAFRTRGEQVAATIKTLVQATHANVKEIFKLIFEWLKMIPGVNRFFLEQEAKIKTDKILAAAEEEKRRGPLA